MKETKERMNSYLTAYPKAELGSKPTKAKAPKAARADAEKKRAERRKKAADKKSEGNKK